jgi:hypothetical protein
MNGYAKFRENSDNHTVQTSPKNLEECQQKDSNHNPDIISPKEQNMKTENFMFRRNHSTTSQRFAHSSNSDLKNMMRRAFSTRKAYLRLEDDGGNEDVGNGDFVQDQDLDKTCKARGNDDEGKKKKNGFKRLKKIFHF